MTWAAVAIGGATLIGGAVQGSAAKRAAKGQANAANQAAIAQQQAAQQANEEQRRLFDQNRRDQLPYMQAGNQGLTALQQGLGLRPTAAQVAEVARGRKEQGNFDAQAYLASNPDVGSSGYLAAHMATGKSPEAVAWMHYMDANSRGDKRAGAWYENPDAPPPAAAPAPATGSPAAPSAGAAGMTEGDLFRDFKASDFQVDPGAEFRRTQGEQAINRNALAAGRYDSGAVLKELQDYNSGLASQEFGNAYTRWKAGQQDKYNRIMDMTQLGKSATNSVNNDRSNYGNAYANNLLGGARAGAEGMTSAANARAAGIVGQANAYGNAASQGMNWWQGQQMVNQLRNQTPRTPSFRAPYGGYGSNDD